MKSRMMKYLKIAKIAAQLILFLVSAFWFVFALLSGAEEYGGGFAGILKNAMNALPWLILFVFNYLVYRFELIGGIILFAFAVSTFFMFDMYEIEQLPVFFLIFVPLFLISLIFTANGIMKRKLKDDF